MCIRQLLQVEPDAGFFGDGAAGLQPLATERAGDHRELLVEPIERGALSRHVEP